MSDEAPLAGDGETRVTTLELFFDLVFVFAVTQVTSLLAADPTALGALRGLLVLAAVWWAWVAYAWLTNSANADRVGVRLSLLGAMGAMLVVSLAVPEAFGRAGLTFALSLFTVRVLHLVLFVVTAPNAAVRRAVGRLAPGVLLGGALLVSASFAHGAPKLALWVVALGCDYAAPIIGGTRGWQVSPTHFAERHGLIVIIALGEAIISLGVGAAGLELDSGLIAGAVAGLVAAFCVWWLYFDRSIALAEEKLRELAGEARNKLARDSYSYLHLPIVAGIVLFALGAKKTLAHVGEPLHGLGPVALAAGPALVLATLSLLRKRHLGRHNYLRLAAALACGSAGAVAAKLSALAGICTLAAILASLVGAEAIWGWRIRRRAGSAS